MAEDALLEKIGNLLKAEREQTRKLVREEVKAETEPIKKDMATWREVASVKKDVQSLVQGQEQTNRDIAILKNGQAHNTTMVEAVLSGQQELQKTTAREASVIDLKATLTKKVNDHEKRIEELEKEVGIPHPHKH